MKKEKIETVRHGKGLIKLEEESAEAIKKAVEQVSQIQSVEDEYLTFEGNRLIAGPGFALIVSCYDVYECPNGYLLHVHMYNGPSWAVVGKTLSQLLDKIPNQVVANRVHGELVKKNLVSIHSH